MANSRYELLDSDEYRLPEGMQRVGYDADTQVYTYKDADGSFWEGEEGNRFGKLHRVEPPTIPSGSGLDVQPYSRYEDYRYMLPFFLLVIVFLLLVFRLVDTKVDCVGGAELHRAQKGESCWKIATDRGTSVEDLKAMNPHLKCENLMPGTPMCVRKATSE